MLALVELAKGKLVFMLYYRNCLVSGRITFPFLLAFGIGNVFFVAFPVPTMYFC